MGGIRGSQHGVQGDGTTIVASGNILGVKDGGIGSTQITDGSVTNTDISATANIDITKVNDKVDYTIGDSALVQHSDSATDFGDTSYTKVAEFQIQNTTLSNTDIRISFELYSVSGNNVTGRIYKNGSGLGTEQTGLPADQWNTFSEDLSFSDGDTCELWLKNETGATNSRWRNFKITGTFAPAGSIYIEEV